MNDGSSNYKLENIGEDVVELKLLLTIILQSIKASIHIW